MLSHKYVTLGRVRAEMKITLNPGDVMIIVGPDSPIGEHLEVQQDGAKRFPFNETFSEMVVARLEPQSQDLQFKTKAEVKAEEEQAKKFSDAQAKTAQDSAARQKKLDDDLQKALDAEKAKKLAEMNKIHDAVREPKK